MTTPNNSTTPTGDLNTAISELALSSEYYQHKANECHDLLESLLTWEQIPSTEFSFSVSGRAVAQFKVGPAEQMFLQTVFMSLMAFYTRKAGDVRLELGKLQQRSEDSILGSEFS